MRQLDFYEFTGIMMPGILFIWAVTLTLPSEWTQAINNGISSIVYLIVLGYALGHLIQAVGNFLEWLFWIPFRGRPTDWLRFSDQNCFPQNWRQAIFEYYGLNVNENINSKEWKGYVTRIQEAVSRLASQGRLQVFNGNYGMFRGMATSFILIGVVYLYFNNLQLRGALFLCLLTGLSLYRFYRFSIYYARTLFASFINSVS